MTHFEQSIESGYAIGVLLGVIVVFFFAGIVFLQGQREKAAFTMQSTTSTTAATMQQEQGTNEQITNLLTKLKKENKQ